MHNQHLGSSDEDFIVEQGEIIVDADIDQGLQIVSLDRKMQTVDVDQSKVEDENVKAKIADEPSFAGNLLEKVINPFSTINDRTIQQMGDYYLPIGGASLAVGGAVAIGMHASSTVSGSLILAGAATTVAGKVVNGIGDRRMLNQPIKAARDLGINQKDLDPKGCQESVAYYANPINFFVLSLSMVGISLGALFLFNVFDRIIAENSDSISEGKEVSNNSVSFSNKEILGLIFSLITFGVNFAKILKGFGINYRDRIIGLSNEQKKEKEENQKWLPEVLQFRQEIVNIREMLEQRDADFKKLSTPLLGNHFGEDGQEMGDMSNKKTTEEVRLKIEKLIDKCRKLEGLLNQRKFDLEVREFIITNMNDDATYPEAEEILKMTGKELYRLISLSSNDDICCDQIIDRWVKIIDSANLARVLALCEYHDFLEKITNSKCDRFVREGVCDIVEIRYIESSLAEAKQFLNTFKDSLSEKAEFFINYEQNNSFGYNMESLKEEVKELTRTETCPIYMVESHEASYSQAPSFN